jgi:hypothetical protein
VTAAPEANPDPPDEPLAASVAAAVVAIEAATVLALWAFSRYFGG